VRFFDSPIFDEEQLPAETWAVVGKEVEIKAKRHRKLQQHEKIP
jgi:hypothetical protein